MSDFEFFESAEVSKDVLANALGTPEEVVTQVGGNYRIEMHRFKNMTIFLQSGDYSFLSIVSKDANMLDYFEAWSFGDNDPARELKKFGLIPEQQTADKVVSCSVVHLEMYRLKDRGITLFLQSGRRTALKTMPIDANMLDYFEACSAWLFDDSEPVTDLKKMGLIPEHQIADEVINYSGDKIEMYHLEDREVTLFLQSGGHTAVKTMPIDANMLDYFNGWVFAGFDPATEIKELGLMPEHQTVDEVVSNGRYTLEVYRLKEEGVTVFSMYDSASHCEYGYLKVLPLDAKVVDYFDGWNFGDVDRKAALAEFGLKAALPERI